MRNRIFIASLLCALLLGASVARCQHLAIQNETGKQTVLSRAEVESLPHVTITTHTAVLPIRSKA
ncbi:MAG: hypothetical protein ABSD75_27595 [Terriglobales bacterium]|jgi:hypothetical protein